MLSQTDKQTGYPSIDKPWLKYYTIDDLKLKNPQCTLFENIYENNKDYLSDIAINYFGKSINYSELFTHVDECVRTLCNIGIKKGDCITLCTAGIPEAIYLVLACSRVGAIANFINPLFSEEQMVERINDTGAKWLVVLDGMYKYVEKVLSSVWKI